MLKRANHFPFPSARRAVPRNFFLPFLLLLILISSCGTTHSLYTIYDLGQGTLPSLRHDIALCRAAGNLVVPDGTLYWQSVGAFYDINHNSDVTVNNCLLARGWRPKVQFAGPFGAGAGDLEQVLKKCGAKSGTSGPVSTAEFSGIVAENIMISASGLGDHGADLKQCVTSLGWRIIDTPPWISPDDASSTYVVDPVAETIADKFAVEGNVVKDLGMGIQWLQDDPEGSGAIDWASARRYVIGLNDRHFGGYSDWRIPRRDEVESLIDFARWNAATDLGNLLKKLGFNGVEGAIYWTSSPITADGEADGIWGVNFATQKYVRLGSSEIYNARVIPVRGKGWKNVRGETALGLQERPEKIGEGEVIAARYHRCKAGACGSTSENPKR